MEISFNTQELRELCENRDYADNQLGVDTANILRRRIADVRAATKITDILLGNPSVFTFNGEQRFQLELEHFGVLSFEPNHIRNLSEQGETIEWDTVSRLKLVDVELSDGSHSCISTELGVAAWRDGSRTFAKK